MTGRMKGQAFVTFPTIESSREALVTVNGYIIKEKPIVVVRYFYYLLMYIVFWKAKLVYIVSYYYIVF